MAKSVYKEFIEWGEIPSSFKCPLSKKLIIEPVIDEDGHSYEKTAIEYWLSNNNNISPITGRYMSSHRLVKNRALKNAIEEYTEDLNIYNSTMSTTISSFNPWFKVMENAITKYKISSEVADALAVETLGSQEFAVLEDIFKNVQTDDELKWFPKTCEPSLLKSAIGQCRWILYPQFRKKVYSEFSQYLKPYASYKDLAILSPLSPMHKVNAEKAYLESLMKPHLDGVYATIRDAVNSFSILYPIPYKVDTKRENTLIEEQMERWVCDGIQMVR